MKNINLNYKEEHRKLSNPEVRNFIAEAYHDNYLSYSAKRNKLSDEILNLRSNANGFSGLDYNRQNIRICLKEIEQKEHEIQYLEKCNALTLILNSNNWEEHDISDYSLMSPAGFYYNFVGTKEEYDNIMSKIEE